MVVMVEPAMRYSSTRCMIDDTATTMRIRKKWSAVECCSILVKSFFGGVGGGCDIPEMLPSPRFELSTLRLFRELRNFHDTQNTQHNTRTHTQSLKCVLTDRFIISAKKWHARDYWPPLWYWRRTVLLLNHLHTKAKGRRGGGSARLQWRCDSTKKKPFLGVRRVCC